MMPSDSSEIKDTHRIKVLSWLLFILVLIPYPSFAQDKVIATYTLPNKVIATYTLPDTPIKPFQTAVLPGSIVNDRKVLLGSVGSDLWHGPNDPQDEFWMLTDRGPNGQNQSGWDEPAHLLGTRFHSDDPPGEDRRENDPDPRDGRYRGPIGEARDGTPQP
jgi:hypothetical protein